MTATFAFLQYMTDVAVLLGADRENASKELWLCIEFEKKIANVRDISHRSKSGRFTKNRLFLGLVLYSTAH